MIVHMSALAVRPGVSAVAFCSRRTSRCLPQLLRQRVLPSALMLARLVVRRADHQLAMTCCRLRSFIWQQIFLRLERWRLHLPALYVLM